MTSLRWFQVGSEATSLASDVSVRSARHGDVFLMVKSVACDIVTVQPDFICANVTHESRHVIVPTRHHSNRTDVYEYDC